jgi:hypothetical protein
MPRRRGTGDRDYELWELQLRLRPGTRQAVQPWINRWLDAKEAIEAESEALYYEVQANWQPPLMRGVTPSKFPDLNFFPLSTDGHQVTGFDDDTH